MSITVAIENLGTVAVADVDLVGFDYNLVREISTSVSQDGRRQETVYRYAVGDPLHPVTIFVTQRYDPTPNNFGKEGSTVSTVRVLALETRTDSVTGEVITAPVEAGIWFTVAGKYIRSVTEISQLLKNVFCLTFKSSMTAGVPDTAQLYTLAENMTRIL